MINAKDIYESSKIDANLPKKWKMKTSWCSYYDI